MTRATKPAELKPSRMRAQLTAQTGTITLPPADPPPPEPIAAADGVSKHPAGKLGLLVSLLAQAPGATMAEMAAATGWQAHSVRGALAGALKKRGFVVSSEKDDGARVYRIVS